MPSTRWVSRNRRLCFPEVGFGLEDVCKIYRKPLIKSSQEIAEHMEKTGFDMLEGSGTAEMLTPENEGLWMAAKDRIEGLEARRLEGRSSTTDFAAHMHDVFARLTATPLEVTV